MTAPATLSAEAQTWPIAGSFTISRESRTSVDVVVATITRGKHTGRGECRPYPRYGESVEGVIKDILEQQDSIAVGITRLGLMGAMPPGAARNAVDCAMWDLEAKEVGVRAWQLEHIQHCEPLVTAYTISLDTPVRMAAAAAASNRPLLKLKLGGDGDDERIAAVREAVPGARLIIDANEAWLPEHLVPLMAGCHAARIELVEQPLPAGKDRALADIEHLVPICADESAHGLDGFDGLAGRYDAINIKLDKTGGLTEALMLSERVRDAGLTLMVGCMLATSLAMAPAMIVAQHADVVDLDGPLLLARDREHAIRYDGSLMHPPEAELWG